MEFRHSTRVSKGYMGTTILGDEVMSLARVLSDWSCSSDLGAMSCLSRIGVSSRVVLVWLLSISK
jgi:hypothetical protein